MKTVHRRDVLGALAGGTVAVSGCLTQGASVDREGAGNTDDDDGSSNGGDGNRSGDDDTDDDSVSNDTDDDSGSNDTDDDSKTSDTDDGNGSSDDDNSITTVDSSIETTASSCAGPDHDWVDIDPTEKSIVLHGAITAPNPCHEAVLETVEIQNDRLTVVVDVESTLEEETECVQCVGGIEYRATVAVSDPDRLERIVVNHSSGGEHTLSQDRVDEGK